MPKCFHSWIQTKPGSQKNQPSCIGIQADHAPKHQCHVWWVGKRGYVPTRGWGWEDKAGWGSQILVLFQVFCISTIFQTRRSWSSIPISFSYVNCMVQFWHPKVKMLSDKDAERIQACFLSGWKHTVKLDGVKRNWTRTHTHIYIYICLNRYK